MHHIPFRLANEEHPLIIVSAAINDNGPYDFLFDTGNGSPVAILLSPSFIEKSKMVIEDDKHAAKTEYQQLRIQRFQIGDLLYKNLTASIVDSLDAFGKQIGVALAGNVGFHFLKKWCVKIDYQKNMLTLSESKVSLSNSQPFENGANGAFILLQTEVNGAGPFRFLLDTGASSSVISPALAAKLDLQGTAIDALSVLGSQGAQMVTLDTLKAAGEIQHGIEAAVIDIFEYTSEAAGIQIDGIVGYSFLRNYSIVIDYPQQRLALTKQDNDKSLVSDNSANQELTAQ